MDNRARVLPALDTSEYSEGMAAVAPIAAGGATPDATDTEHTGTAAVVGFALTNKKVS